MEIYIFVNVFVVCLNPRSWRAFSYWLSFQSLHIEDLFLNFFDKCLQKMKMSPEPLVSSEAETACCSAAVRGKKGFYFFK